MIMITIKGSGKTDELTYHMFIFALLHAILRMGDADACVWATYNVLLVAVNTCSQRLIASPPYGMG